MAAKQEKASEDTEEEAKKVAKLRKKVGEARQVHRIADDPYLKVVELDRFRASISGALWFFLSVGLAYTTVGVHDFIAEGLHVADPMWWGAWAVEPALAGMLITVLRWEAAMLMRGIRIESGWVTFTKWVLLGSTLIMNVLSSLDGSTVEKFLHVAFPGLVFCLAEVMPVVQDRFAKARAKILAEIAQVDAQDRETEQRTDEASPPSTGTDLHTEFAAHASTLAPPSPGLPPLSVSPPQHTPPATVRPPKLPAPMLKAIEDKAAEVANAGRAMTAADVQAVAKLPAGMAEQAAKYYAAANAPA
ncbi:hypothetical protein K3N28_19240 [Glycomyces sp. TRM65418]|uniref:hypothetical protein n=1 Tax=Glycomyces sp. TRM65418 TaxID=2867006 RepID=UPI001CE59483|nr:hypothetical protein [Glycomyces sp. TRM65418]MCC3765196.1 hypothetical protein [Glycomyces sp. TRM65418]QZD54821.1 hypothetical protein K3N28_19145 [Glycomyces sp. TRM65418]